MFGRRLEEGKNNRNIIIHSASETIFKGLRSTIPLNIYGVVENNFVKKTKIPMELFFSKKYTIVLTYSFKIKSLADNTQNGGEKNKHGNAYDNPVTLGSMTSRDLYYTIVNIIFIYVTKGFIYSFITLLTYDFNLRTIHIVYRFTRVFFRHFYT